MDPNAFYSTLAQSTTAIVGLIGGFLIARLIAQRRRSARSERIGGEHPKEHNGIRRRQGVLWRG